MLFEDHFLWLQKGGNEEQQYEDAFQRDPNRGLVAIADGASEGYASGAWASILVHRFIEEPPDQLTAESFWPWVAKHRPEWLLGIDFASLGWNHQIKAEGGAFTTFLCAQFQLDRNQDRPDTLSLRVLAVGDCCLFHVRGQELVQWVPPIAPENFSTRTELVASLAHRQDLNVRAETFELRVQPGDLLFLASDALACWLLQQTHAGDVDWNKYWMLDIADWRQEIVHLRDQGSMTDDDVTLLVLRLMPIELAEPMAGQDETHDETECPAEPAETGAEITLAEEPVGNPVAAEVSSREPQSDGAALLQVPDDAG